jgi:L-cysteine S-thiosulfotransferase
MAPAPRFAALLAMLLAGAAHAQGMPGREIFIRADKGNCLACHQVPEGAGPAVRSDIGPRLDAARLKGWDRARLRQLLDDPQRVAADTVMPPYGRHRILESGEIDAVIDYLHALP